MIVVTLSTDKCYEGTCSNGYDKCYSIIKGLGVVGPMRCGESCILSLIWMLPVYQILASSMLMAGVSNIIPINRIQLVNIYLWRLRYSRPL